MVVARPQQSSLFACLPKQAKIINGSIVFDGHDVLNIKPNELNEVRRRKMSMIFQDPTASLNPVFTIGKQISDSIKYSDWLTGKKEAIKEERSSLNDCSMPDPGVSWEIIHSSYLVVCDSVYVLRWHLQLPVNL